MGNINTNIKGIKGTKGTKGVILHAGIYDHVLDHLPEEQVIAIYNKWMLNRDQQEANAVYKAETCCRSDLLSFIRTQRTFTIGTRSPQILALMKDLTGSSQTGVNLSQLQHRDLIAVILLLDLHKLLKKDENGDTVGGFLKPGAMRFGVSREIPDYRIQGLWTEDLDQLLYDEPAPTALDLYVY